MSEPVLAVAAKALIVRDDGRVLILRESATHDTNAQKALYGLVGGRLNPGERFFDALAREIREETGLEVEVLRPLYVGERRPVIKGVPHQVVAMFMLCRAKNANVTLSEEHDGFEWIDPAKYGDYEFMDPDDKVIDAYLSTPR